MAKVTAKKKNTVPEFAEIMREMRTKGLEAEIPSTRRKIRLHTIEAAELLRTGNMPDMLQPLVVKTIYQDVPDRELRDFLGQVRGSAEEALKMEEMLNFVCKAAIADNTKVEELTPGEKRWVFRLAMASTELLADFCYPEERDVEPVANGDDVPQATE